MRKFRVTLHETKISGRAWESNHFAIDGDDDGFGPDGFPLSSPEWQVIEKAVQKHFGKSAFFFEDSGLRGMSRKYGQVFRPCRVGTGYTSVTCRIYADISAI